MCCTVLEFCLMDTVLNWLGGFLVLSLDDGIQRIHRSCIICMYPLSFGFLPWCVSYMFPVFITQLMVQGRNSGESATGSRVAGSRGCRWGAKADPADQLLLLKLLKLLLVLIERRQKIECFAACCIWGLHTGGLLSTGVYGNMSKLDHVAIAEGGLVGWITITFTWREWLKCVHRLPEKHR